MNTIQPFTADRRPRPPKPKPAPLPSDPPQDATINYNSQDRTVMPSQSIVIKGMQPGPQVEKAQLDGNFKLDPIDGKYVYGECDSKLPAALSFAAVAKTIETFSAANGQPVTWAFGDSKLIVTPDEGVDFNAYYSRDSGGVHFFHGVDPVTNSLVMSGSSGEVVSHETGHAILDGLRPGYLETWSPDPGAFHESFGDMMGMLMAFQDDRAVGLAAIQTGGDLRKPNILANTGEELGTAINDKSGSNRTGGDYVRTAINQFKWQDPSTLPDRGGPDQLGSEVHSFSRLWTGAFYDVLTSINDDNMKAGMDAKAALQATGKEGLQLLTNLMKVAPQGDFTYKDMAHAFVTSDQQLNNGKRADLIQKVYTDRLILADLPTPPAPPPTKAASQEVAGADRDIFTSTNTGRVPLAEVTRTVRLKLSGDEFGMFKGAVVDTVVDRDGSLAKDAEVTERTKKSLKQLIETGKIRYTDPGQRLQPKDYFDPHGQPYTGVVKWENDQMVIERVKIAS